MVAQVMNGLARPGYGAFGDGFAWLLDPAGRYDVKYKHDPALAKATEFVERRGGDQTAKRVVELWGRVLNAIESGDLEPVSREIDWVTKLRLIERYQDKHDLPLSHPRVAQMDLAYHDLRRGRGLYGLMERRKSVDRVATDIEI